MGTVPHLITYPLFRLTMALATGIFLFDRFLADCCSLELALLGLVLSVVAAAACHGMSRPAVRYVFGAVTFLCFFWLGGVLYLMEDRQVSYEWPSDEVAYQGVVETVPQRKGKTWQAQVKVMSWKPAGDSLQATGQWKKVDRSILLYWMPDTTGQTILQCGDKICFYASVSRPVSDVDFSGFDYGAYLHRQGISGTGLAFAGRWMRLEQAGSRGFRQQALLMREHVVRRYEEWGLDGDVLAVVSALTVGDKSDLTPELKATYSASGASHVLALSGLHIGILAGILTLLLYPLRLFPLGRSLTGVLTVLLLWAFAFLSGLSASVVRAVTMFSLYVGASFFLEGRFSGFLSLSLAAFLMLLYRPFYLFDVSFQLSFLAVWGILLFYPVFSGWLPAGCRRIRWLWNTLSVSMAAQLGTLPFVLFYFGAFPTYFLLANLLVTPLAVCILGSSLAALAFEGIPWMGERAADLVRLSAEALNGSMFQIQQLSGSQVTSVYISGFQLVLCYLLLALLYAYWTGKRKHVLIPFLIVLNVLLGTRILDWIKPVDERLYFARSELYSRRRQSLTRLAEADGVYRIDSLSVGLMKSSRWKGKQAAPRLPLDYAYICRGFKGNITSLSRVFELKHVVLDLSLSDAYRLSLKEECKKLGIPCVEISSKGSWGIVRQNLK